MGLDRAIDITAEQRKTVLALHQRYLPNTTAWVYGSRAKWTSRPQSDLDLLVFATPEQNSWVSDLREAFEESNLPFRVDLFVWDEVPEQFRKQIEAEHAVLLEREERGVDSGWREVPVSKVASAVIGGTPARSAAEYWGGDIPWATAKDVAAVSSRYLDQVQDCITEQGLKSSAAKLMPEGTVVITARGTVGALAQLRREMTFNQTCYAILPKDELDGNFLFWALKGTLSEMRSLTYGTVFETITRRTFDNWRIPLPPLPEQRAIAHILGTLDDKIELNRRMNQTLEEIARALFKSWFVDFDPVRAKAALKRSSLITPPLRGSRQAKGVSPQARRWGEIKRRYAPQTLQKARALRQTRTDAGGLLWHFLRNKQLDGYEFRRQQPIGPYVADFACMSRKLLIELDGSQHAERRADDEQRDTFLQEKGYRVLRFWNGDVFENCFGVLERVYEALTFPPPHQPSPVGSASATPPQGGSDWSVERARAYLDGMDGSIVDLFPDRLVDSELGEIPEGWEVGALDDAIEILSGGTPRTSVASYWGGDIPWYTAKDAPSLSDVFVLDTERTITQAGVENSATNILLFGTTIITARGTVGRLACLGVPMAMNQTCYGIRGAQGYPSFFTYWNVRRTVDELQVRTHGTIFDTITRQTFKLVETALPPAELAEAFELTVTPVMGRILCNLLESRTLAAQRDALLPKLVLGEVRRGQ